MARNPRFAQAPRFSPVRAAFTAVDYLLKAAQLGTLSRGLKAREALSEGHLGGAASYGPTKRRKQRADEYVLSKMVKKRQRGGGRKPQVLVARKPKPKVKRKGRKPNQSGKKAGGASLAKAFDGLKIGGLSLGVHPLPSGKTQGGSATYRVALAAIKVALTPTTGSISTSVAVDNALFAKMATFANLYDEVRLRELEVTLMPMLGVTAAGQTIAYFDYRSSDANKTTLADASQMQDAVSARCGEPLRIKWKKQSNVDDEFITTAQTANFNSKTGHKLVIVTEGSDCTTALYQVYIRAVLEYTGSKV